MEPELTLLELVELALGVLARVKCSSRRYVMFFHFSYVVFSFS